MENRSGRIRGGPPRTTPSPQRRFLCSGFLSLSLTRSPFHLVMRLPKSTFHPYLSNIIHLRTDRHIFALSTAFPPGGSGHPVTRTVGFRTRVNRYVRPARVSYGIRSGREREKSYAFTWKRENEKKKKNKYKIAFSSPVVTFVSRVVLNGASVRAQQQQKTTRRDQRCLNISRFVPRGRNSPRRKSPGWNAHGYRWRWSEYRPIVPAGRVFWPVHDSCGSVAPRKIRNV